MECSRIFDKSQIRRRYNTTDDEPMAVTCAIFDP
jgi:hypothetical protein